MMAVSRVIPLFPAHKTRDLNNWGKVRQKAEKKGKIWAVAKPSRGFIPPPLRWLCRTNWRRRWWIKYEPVKGLAPIWVRRRGGGALSRGLCAICGITDGIFSASRLFWHLPYIAGKVSGIAFAICGEGHKAKWSPHNRKRISMSTFLTIGPAANIQYTLVEESANEVCTSHNTGRGLNGWN